MTDLSIVRSSHRKPRPRSFRNSGYVTVVLLFFLLVFAVIMTSLASLTTSQLRNSRQGLIRAKALTLAEAGIDDTIQRLGPTGVGPDYKGTSPNKITLNEKAGVPFGTFSTSVSWVSVWARKVVSVGTTVENGSLTLTSIVDISKLPLGGDKAAIKSNGTIDIKGTANITTLSATENDANCMANGTISAGGGSVIDGGLSSYTGVDQGVGLVPNVKLESPLLFLTDAMTAAMKVDWMAKAKLGGEINASVRNTRTIAGSKYIRGDIQLNGSSLVTLSGTGNDVVFVDGDVTLSGGTLTNGVTLIVNGTFKQSGQSVYKITPGLPTPTLFVYNSNNETVGITLSGGGANDSQGIIYGVKGDINVAGGSVLTGAIYCGDPNAGVKSAGNFTLNYPLGMNAAVEIPDGALVAQLFEL